MSDKRTVLITGCSDGGLGSALAIAFHDAGWRVFASARNVKKLKDTEALGIESIQLDVTSAESIRTAATKVSELTGGSLDALLNNAGAVLLMPLLDVDIQEIRNLFELNVFSMVAVTQQFVPLLRKSSKEPMVMNQTSIAGELPIMWQASYNASKAATSSITATLGLEFEPLGIKVVDLKTGCVKSNIFSNAGAKTLSLPATSVYTAAKEEIEIAMKQEESMKASWDANYYAQSVVKAVSGTNLPSQIWKGDGAVLVWFLRLLPWALLSSICRGMGHGAEVVKKVKEQINGAKGDNS